MYAEPAAEGDLIGLLETAKQRSFPCLVLGRGSNLLVSDAGFPGLVLATSRMNLIEVNGNILRAECGVPLSKLANAALRAGLSGAEFCHGIPGSLGGAVYMNAGAYEHSMAEIVTKVRLLEDGKLLELPASEMDFGYRRSRVMRKGGTVLSAEIVLRPGDPEKIADTMRTLDEKRSQKQPLDYPSAGSYFKRPEGHFAGALIEQAGLKGLTVGGAQVSEKHAGFIINRGGATCSDILALQEEVTRRVEEKFSVHLEREVQFVGK